MDKEPSISVFYLYDGEYFKHLHLFDHFTIVVKGSVSQSDSANFGSKLRVWYRTNKHDRRARIDVIAKGILTSMGYEVITPNIIEDVDFTGFDIQP
jgi:hypothetical protein